jgi:nucleoside phosphorylase
VCALRDPELAEVHKLPWNWRSSRPLDDVTFVRDGFVEVEGRRITVCATAAPRMGMVATALHSASLIAQLRPRIIAMTGICAGVRGKVSLGDVLFADPAWDFQSGKRVKDKENTQFSMRPHQLAAHAKIRAHIEQIRDDHEGLTKVAGAFDGRPPGISRVVIGPVASGSAVLADGEVIKEIREQHQELVGVEMEIYGLYAAAHAASGPQPLCFALKAVCDFADPDKEDGQQRYAAYASARVLQLLIERFGPRLLA